ncbi:MAG: rRNA maturation RNase YbeY [bacterium]|nr:rRNA maturation RNase YbeY [bacterium]
MKLNIIDSGGYRLQYEHSLEMICHLVDEELGTLLGQVNLVFSDDETVHQLNREHRGKDKTTDVLTFTYYSGDKTGKDELLGEVILSIPQTRRQADQEECSFESELYKLCIHGLLHLRGYDHEENEDYRVMKLLEDKIMDRLQMSLKH